MSRSTFSGPIRSKNGIEVATDGDVSLTATLIAAGSNSLDITTAQAVEASASIPDTRLKITVNGTEYYLPLEAV